MFQMMVIYRDLFCLENVLLDLIFMKSLLLICKLSTIALQNKDVKFKRRMERLTQTLLK